MHTVTSMYTLFTVCWFLNQHPDRWLFLVIQALAVHRQSQKEFRTDKHCIPRPLSFCKGKSKSSPITGCRFVQWKTHRELPRPFSKPSSFPAKS